MKSNKSIVFAPKLKNQIRRRRLLGEKILQLETLLGTKEKAIDALETMRLENDEKLPLWKLAEKISRQANGGVE